MLLVVLALFVLAGSAYTMSKPTSFKTGASNVFQSVSGKLVKKGSQMFSACARLSAFVSYGLLGTGTSECLPLQIKSSLADPLVDQKVFVTGTLQNSIFYATSLVVASK